MAAAAGGASSSSTATAQRPDVEETAVQLQDPVALRRELWQLRRGRELLARRMQTARRELAATRRRQHEAEKAFLEQEAAVAELSRRLGCSAEGLPEIEEWRELARQHMERAKELRRQIAEENSAHEKHMEELRQELARGGVPETAKSQEAAECRLGRRAADEHCARLQVVRDYIRGDLEGISLEELRDLLAVDPAETKEAVPSTDAYDEVIEAAEKVLEERHQQRLRDVVQLSNTVLGRKEAYLKALASNLLVRGLEDVKRCTPAEQVTLRDILSDVEAVCTARLAGGRGPE